MNRTQGGAVMAPVEVRGGQTKDIVIFTHNFKLR